MAKLGKIKNIFNLCFLAVLVTLMMGCSKEADNIGTPENPYTILWYPFTGEPEDDQLVIEKVNEYIRDKIGAVLEIKYLKDYPNNINIIMSSGEKFDICFASSWCNDYRVAARKGYFLELDELLDKYGKGIKKVVNPVFFKGTEIDGKCYGVPINNIAACQTNIIFNKNYLDKYNIDLSGVKTYKDLGPIFEIIKKNEPKTVVFSPWELYIPNDVDYILFPVMPGAVQFSKDKYKVINQYEIPEYIEQMKTFREFYLKGYIPADVNLKLYEMGPGGNLFARSTSYYPGIEADREKTCGYPIKTLIMVNPPPIGSIGLGGQLLTISSTSERPDIVMKFLNLLNTDKYLRNLIGHGIEDLHFVKVGDNTIRILPRGKNYTTFQFAMGNLFITYVDEAEPADKWEQYAAIDDSAVKSPIIGFTFDPNPVKTEIAAVSNIVNEFKGLRLGTMDVDKNLPLFIDKMKKNGMDKLLAEMQRQLDAWWAEKEKK